MIYDLHQVGDKDRFDTDICVVGSGAAGLALAREFLGGTPRVLIVESGGGNREETADALNAGSNAGIPNSSFSKGRVRVLGGTTDVWPGACIPLAESDFLPRPWVPHSGWPFGREHLQPYYARAAELFRVPMDDFQRDVWTTVGTKGPEFDPALLGHAVNLFSPRPHRYLGKMLQRALERSSNVDVLLHATASEIVTNPEGSEVAAIEVRSLAGKKARIHARVFVICGGGFENARLLLLSRRYETAGVGNRHDVVGRYFQDHPAGKVATIHTDKPKRLQSPYGVSFRGFPPRPGPYPKIRLSYELQQREQVLNCSANVVWDIDIGSAEQGMLQVFRALRGLRRPLLPWSEVKKIIRDMPGMALFLARYLRGQASLTPPRSMWLLSMAEQAPNPASRIQLAEERDALGLHKLRLDWQTTELDHRTHAAMANAVRGEFGRLGLARVEVADWVRPGAAGWSSNLLGAYHPTGSTRMSHDPKLGVVDEQCRVHGVANLYIGGSSVFPTSGYANPTFTIAALAVRLADRLKATLA
jgi:choline dehydrogenase-like flavoprotein